eukprot:TRINITY_DN2351_c0_g1_i4.p1 TRINITY_DN2351_c0_g1~~TRINITY_DN2351_c0_g1_i4.p1  ORF type:complete len:2545 (+),score=435.40 TRINITY_DN2351_c0_g1_i4:90-7724(+)
MSAASGSKKDLDDENLDRILAKVSGSSDIDASLRKIRSDEWDRESESTERHGSSVKDKRSKSSKSIRQAVKFAKLEDEAKTAKKKHQANLDLLVTRLEAAQKERDAAEEENARLTTLCTQWADKEAVFLASQEQLKTLKEKLRLADTQALTTAEDLATTKAQAAEATAKIAELQQMVTDTEQQTTELQKLRSMLADAQKKTASLEADVQQMGRQQLQLERAALEVTTLTERKNAMERAAEIQKEREQHMREATGTLKHKVAELEEANAVLNGQLEQQKTAATSNNAVFGDLQKQLNDARAEINELEAQKTAQTSALLDTEVRLKQAQDDILSHKRDAHEKEGHVAGKLAELKKVHAEVVQERDASRALVATSEDEVRKLRSRLELVTATAKQNEQLQAARIDEMQKVLAQSEMALSTSRGDTETARKENATIIAELHKLEEAQLTATANYNTLHKESAVVVTKLSKRLQRALHKYARLLAVIQRHELFAMSYEDKLATDVGNSIPRLKPQAEANIIAQCQESILSDSEATDVLVQEAKERLTMTMQESFNSEQRRVIENEAKGHLMRQEIARLSEDPSVLGKIKEEALHTQHEALTARAASELVEELKQDVAKNERTAEKVISEAARQLVVSGDTQLFSNARMQAEKFVVETEGHRMYEMAKSALLEATVDEIKSSDEIQTIHKAAVDMLREQELEKARHDAALCAKLRGDVAKRLEVEIEEKELDTLRKNLMRNIEDELSTREGEHLLAEARKELTRKATLSLQNDPRDMQAIIDSARNEIQLQVAQEMGAAMMEEAKLSLLKATIEELREDRAEWDTIAHQAYKTVEWELMEVAREDEAFLRAARARAESKVVDQLLVDEREMLRSNALKAAEEEVSATEKQTLYDAARATVLELEIERAQNDSSIMATANAQALEISTAKLQSSPNEMVAIRERAQAALVENMKTDSDLQATARDSVVKAHIETLVNDEHSMQILRNEAEQELISKLLNSKLEASVRSSVDSSARDLLVEHIKDELKQDPISLQTAKEAAVVSLVEDLKVTKEVHEHALTDAIALVKKDLALHSTTRDLAIKELQRDESIRDEAKDLVCKELMSSNAVIEHLVSEARKDPVSWNAIQKEVQTELKKRAETDSTLRDKAEAAVQQEIIAREGDAIYQQAVERFQHSCVQEMKNDATLMDSLRVKAEEEVIKNMQETAEVKEAAKQAAVANALESEHLRQEALIIAQEQVAHREGEELCAEARAILLRSAVDELREKDTTELQEEARKVLVHELLQDPIKVSDLRQEASDVIKNQIMTAQMEELREKAIAELVKQMEDDPQVKETARQAAVSKASESDKLRQEALVIAQEQVAQREGEGLCAEARAILLRSAVDELREKDTTELQEEARKVLVHELLQDPVKVFDLRQEACEVVKNQIMTAQMEELREKAIAELVKQMEDDPQVKETARQAAVSKASESDQLRQEALIIAQEQVAQREGEGLCAEARAILLESTIDELKEKNIPSIQDDAKKVLVQELLQDPVRVAALRQQVSDTLKEKVMAEEGSELLEKVRVLVQQEVAERDAAQLCADARGALFEEMQRSIKEDEQHMQRIHDEAEETVREEVLQDKDTIRRDVVTDLAANLLATDSEALTTEARRQLLCEAVEELKNSPESLDAIRGAAVEALKAEMLETEKDALTSDALESIKIEIIERDGEDLSREAQMKLTNELLGELREDDTLMEELRQQLELKVRDELWDRDSHAIRECVMEQEKQRLLEEEGTSMRQELKEKIKAEIETSGEVEEIRTACVAEIKADLFANEQHELLSKAANELQGELVERKGAEQTSARQELHHKLCTFLKEDPTKFQELVEEVGQQVKQDLSVPVSEEMRSLSLATAQATHDVLLESVVEEEATLRASIMDGYDLIRDLIHLIVTQWGPYSASRCPDTDHKLNQWDREVTEREQAVFSRHAMLLELERNVKGTGFTECVPPPLSPEPIHPSMSRADRERVLERREKAVMRSWELLMQREANLLHCAQDTLYAIPDELELSLPDEVPGITEQGAKAQDIATPTACIPPKKHMPTTPTASSDTSGSLKERPVSDLSDAKKQEIKQAIEAEIVAAEAERAAANPHQLRRLEPRKPRTTRYLPPKKRPDDGPLEKDVLSLEDKIRLGLVVVSPHNGWRQRNSSLPPSPREPEHTLKRRQSAPPELFKQPDTFNLEKTEVPMRATTPEGASPPATPPPLAEPSGLSAPPMSLSSYTPPVRVSQPPAVVTVDADYYWYTKCSVAARDAIHQSLIAEVATVIGVQESCVAVVSVVAGSIKFMLQLSPREGESEDDLLRVFHSKCPIELTKTLNLIKELQQTKDQEVLAGYQAAEHSVGEGAAAPGDIELTPEPRPRESVASRCSLQSTPTQTCSGAEKQDVTPPGTHGESLLTATLETPEIKFPKALRRAHDDGDPALQQLELDMENLLQSTEALLSSVTPTKPVLKAKQRRGIRPKSQSTSPARAPRRSPSTKRTNSPHWIPPPCKYNNTHQQSPLKENKSRSRSHTPRESFISPTK